MSQDTMDSYDDGIRDAIKVMESFAVRSYVIDAVRDLMNSPYLYAPGSPKSQAARKLFTATPKELGEAAVKGAIPYPVCDGKCPCGMTCALDQRHRGHSACRCDILGCDDEDIP